MADDQLVWARINLGDIAAVVDDYRVWKFDPWYSRVNWARVNHAADELLEDICEDGVAAGLFGLTAPVEAQLQKTDRAGLWALLHAPIDVTPRQIYNGGHRLTAMRSQGLGWVPAQVYRSDVDAHQIYPRERP